MPDSIEQGIEALSRVAVIDGRGKLHDGEVITYHPLTGHDEEDVRAAVQGQDLNVTFFRREDKSWVVLRRSAERDTRRLPWLNISLLLATILTTLAAGAMLEGYNIFKSPGTLIHGWPFSVTLMAILGLHEFGHYYFARKHHVDVSLPYFIPVPPPVTFIGTFGAVIRMRGPIPNRLALLEIGAAGPIAGFLVAVPVLLLGLSLSSVETIPSGGLILGDSLLMKIATAVMFPGLGPEEDILLHPVAFAGWIGLLITMLNLLPLAQLDGGHITYALLGDRQEVIGKVIFIALIPMGIFLSFNWLFWGFLILILMRTVKHPPVHDVHRPLTAHERWIGIVCLVIFVLSFIPVPFDILPPG